MKKNKKNLNNTNNYKKSILRRNIITLSSSFALMVVALIATILVLNTHTSEKKFMAYDGYYNSTQDTIDSTSIPPQEYIKMEKLYTINNNIAQATSTTPSEGQYVTIESKDDVYAFSHLCNTTSRFLGYKYKLLKDIDWDETGTVNRYFEPIIGSFTGEFDGNGYTIKNMEFDNILSGSLSTDYAMFVNVAEGATVKNLGIIDSTIQIVPSSSDRTTYIATLCAVNYGTIDHVFVRDNQDSVKKEYKGMQLSGANYYVSGIVAVNYGTFTNAYYAGSSIFDPDHSSKSQYEFQEVLLQNTGTIGNLYFYDELIANSSSEMDSIENSNVSIEYSQINDIRNYIKHYGIWCESLDDLNEEVPQGANTRFITASYYSDENNTNVSNFGDLINYITPLVKKLDETNVSYDSTTKKYSIKINSSDDFNYILNNMDINAKFTDSSMIYQLNCDINMNDTAKFTYDDSIQSTITSFNTSSPRKIYFDNYNYSVSASTYQAYGVFPFFSGELSYINFVVGTSDNQVSIDASASNVNAIGTVVGYAETATIDNINVYCNIKVDNSIGKYFIGGIVGVIGDRTVISNSTVNGKITTTNTSPNSFTDSGDVEGIAIGGAVGISAKSGGSLDTILSTVEITSAGYTGKVVNIGGVIGAGYLIDSFQLQNNGTINVVGASDSTAAYSEIYLAGVIGRFLGMYSQANMFTNNGDITLYQQSNAPTYYAGILNADIKTSGQGELFYLTYKGKAQFWASCLSNGANINISGTNTNANFMYTYGVNLKNANGFATKLSGVYNLNYRFDSASAALGAMTINMNQIKEFAPVILSNNSSNSTYNISLTTVYNLRDITYDTSATLNASTSGLKYTGCVLADYVNYIDVRNEGNQTMTIDNALTGNVYITGLFYELTGGFSAKSIYNGGNITVTYTAIVTGNINASGICYANKNGFSNSEIQKYNPSNDNFDKDAVGSINNCINNGAIEVTNPAYANISFEVYEVWSANGQTLTENHWKIIDGTKPSSYLIGNINVTGIAVYNYSVLTNTFNIGDMFAANYICNNLTDDKNEINASGLVSYNIGKYAIIENCANDGDIKAINMSFYMVYTNGGEGNKPNINETTAKNAYVVPLASSSL